MSGHWPASLGCGASNKALSYAKSLQLAHFLFSLLTKVGVPQSSQNDRHFAFLLAAICRADSVDLLFPFMAALSMFA